jgi:phage FluMu protein gp41
MMNKTKSVRIRLTDKEWDDAELASLRLLGTHNKSRLIRKLLRDYLNMGPDLTDREIQDFREAVRQLTGVAINLNQITMKINSDTKNLDKLSGHDLDAIKKQVRNVNDTLKNYIQRTLHRYQDIVQHAN